MTLIKQIRIILKKTSLHQQQAIIMLRKQRIHDILSEHLAPTTLIIEDESSRHQVPQGAESHFKVVAVSRLFEPLSRIQRHRLVHSLLACEFDQGLHALTLHLYTDEQWQRQHQEAPASPACHGGKKRHHEL